MQANVIRDLRQDNRFLIFTPIYSIARHVHVNESSKASTWPLGIWIIKV